MRRHQSFGGKVIELSKVNQITPIGANDEDEGDDGHFSSPRKNFIKPVIMKFDESGRKKLIDPMNNHQDDQDEDDMVMDHKELTGSKISREKGSRKNSKNLMMFNEKKSLANLISPSNRNFNRKQDENLR